MTHHTRVRAFTVCLRPRSFEISGIGGTKRIGILLWCRRRCFSQCLWPLAYKYDQREKEESFLTNKNSAMATQDCQICLESMSEGDFKYPVLCPEKCGFNFCLSCVQHLVETSEHDYEEASDGNRHVKVKLQCPQCRGTLKYTIRDTLLMRKALIAQEYATVPDQELNATELRLKHEFVQVYAKEVEHAQARLRKFQRDNDHGEIQKSITLEPSGSEDSNSKQFKDETLFGGMEYVMSDSELSYVTELMISGDADKLAQAAQIMHGIMQISLQGLTHSKTRPEASRSSGVT